MDLSVLQRETVIGLNKIFLGVEKFDFYPRYYVAVNRKVLEQSVTSITALNCVKFISDRADGLIPENGLTYQINTTRAPSRFCHDIGMGVHEGWTVTSAALHVAYYLGFTEVILIGMDHSYQYTGDRNQNNAHAGQAVIHSSWNYIRHAHNCDNPDTDHPEH